MSNAHSRRRAQNYQIGKEIPGIILGIVLLGILVALSYVLGILGFYGLGNPAISYGLLGSGFMGYLYAALNRRRKYSDTLGFMAFGYFIWAFLIPMFVPAAAIISNVIQASSFGFFVALVYYLAILLLNVAALVYAKRTDLR